MLNITDGNHQKSLIPAVKPPIRYGVVGLGRMGSLHVEVLNGMLPGVRLGAFTDNDPKKHARFRRRFPDAFITEDYRKLVGQVDAVSICTPTETHCEIAEFFMENKIPALVEKPIASNLTEAEKILWASQANKTHLHVGHVERFNPAVVAAKGLIRTPIFIEAVRFGPYEPRVHDIGVILDLMIHDLDLILWMLNDLNVTLEEYSGQGLSIISPHEDLAKVRLRFKERKQGYSIHVDLTANRLSMERFRKMRIFQGDSYISMDLLNHKIRYSKARRVPLINLDDIETTTPKLTPTNPLQEELKHFLISIRNNAAHDIHPLEAWDALELALQLNRVLDRKNMYVSEPSKPPYAPAVS